MIVTFVCVAVYLVTNAYPLLSYHEGWCTFYYESHYILEHFSSYDGICVLFRSFFLQFFAHPYHGAIVVGGLVSLLSMVVVVLLWKVLTRFLNNRVSLFVVPLSSLFLCFWFCLLLVSSLCRVRMISLISENTASGRYTLQFMRASHYIRNGEWDNVIDVCKKESPVNVILLQNCLNLAKAEKRELGQTLFDEPCLDIRSVFTSDVENQYVAALLSDIYYSMGHIAMSQRYAFEANEKMDNMSPRLLQRLVMTNIIYGHYAVAEKYLRLLRHAVYYKDWCDGVEQELKQDEIGKDSMFRAKRKCLFEDNRFSGIKGLDDDLLQVARSTRGTQQCRVTLDYLGALYILAGYQSKFAAMVEEFKATGDLPLPLPKCFERYYTHSVNEETR